MRDVIGDTIIILAIIGSAFFLYAAIKSGNKPK